MPRFMLDTDTCSCIMKRSQPLVLKRVQDADALRVFLRYVGVLGFADAAARHYAEIRADLTRRGAMIGANDLFIAAHARALGLTLVTDNTAEFERVSGLALENWTIPARRKT